VTVVTTIPALTIDLAVSGFPVDAGVSAAACLNGFLDQIFNVDEGMMVKY